MKKTAVHVLVFLILLSWVPLRAQARFQEFLERLTFDFEYQVFLNNYGQYPGFRVSGPGSFLGKKITWGSTFNAGEWHKGPYDSTYVTIRSLGVFGELPIWKTREDRFRLNVSPRLVFLFMNRGDIQRVLFAASPGVEVALVTKMSEDFSVTAGGAAQYVKHVDIPWSEWPLSFVIRFSFNSPWKAFRRADTVGESRGYKKAKNEYEQTLQFVSKEKENLMDSLKFAALEMKKLTADRSTFPENERQIKTKQEARFLQVFNTKDTSRDSPIILGDDSFDAGGRLRSGRLNDLVAILVSNTEYFWKLEYGELYSENQMMRLVDEIVRQIPELRNKILLSERASRASDVHFICLGRFSFQ